MSTKEAITYSLFGLFLSALLALGIAKGCANDARRIDCAESTFASCVLADETECALATRVACGFSGAP